MNEDKNDVITNVDSTIEEVCKWIKVGLKKSELYPIDTIKALAELIHARTELSHQVSSDNE